MKKPVIMWAVLNCWGQPVHIAYRRKDAIRMVEDHFPDLNWRQLRGRYDLRAAKVEVREVEQ